MPKRIAICIGTNYLDTDYELNYACADAEAVAKLLGDKARGGFDEVIKLPEAEATKENIISTINQVLLGYPLTSDDLVLIYFSGHGALDKADNLFLVPHNFRFIHETQTDKSSMVYMADLERYLDNTNAGTIILMLDACHAGGAGKLLGRIKYKDNANVIVIGAARFSQKAEEQLELAQGRFTQALLEAINQRPNEGEWITLPQTLAFIEKEMAKLDTNQMMEVSSHAINQQIKLFRNPLYSLISESFIEQVKELYEISGWQILPTQPNLTSPNTFIIRKQLGLGINHDTLIFCLDNTKVNVVQTDIEQIYSLFKKYKEQVNSGMIITTKLLPTSIKLSDLQIKHGTVDDLLHSLINFDSYLKRLIDEFASENPDYPTQPPLEKMYVELEAKTNDPTDPRQTICQPITEMISNWLADEQQPIAIILGGYGTGKTTVVRKLAHDMAKAYRESEHKYGLRIPILIPLYLFSTIEQIDLENFIISYLKRYCEVTNPNFDAFKKMNTIGSFLLIFDGFDEIAIQPNEDVIQSHFIKMVRLLTSLQVKMLITSRPELFLKQQEERIIQETLNEYSKYPEIKRFELQLFEPEQIKLFLQQHPNTQNAWEYYYTYINKLTTIENLVNRPVLLYITIKTLPLLIEAGQPITRPHLYETYLGEEIKRQQKTKQRPFLIKDKATRLSYISAIAEYLYREGEITLTVEQMQEILKSKFTSEQRGEVEAYVRDLLACSFMTRSGDEWRFSHFSFLEYLVAKTLQQEIETQTPVLFKELCLAKEMHNWLLDLHPQPDISWRETLWSWIKSTTATTRKESLYLGGNAITLLHLAGESLIAANLQRTVLMRADLTQANLTNAQFQRADLLHADLSLANLTDAQFQEANLTWATIWNVQFANKSYKGTDLEEYIKTSKSFEQANLDNTIYNNFLMDLLTDISYNIGNFILEKTQNMLTNWFTHLFENIKINLSENIKINLTKGN